MSALTLQADEGSFDGSFDPKLGIVAIRLKCLAPDWRTAVTGTIPDGFDELVENAPRTFGRRKSGDQGGFDVMVSLEGHLTPDAADGEEYGFEGATSEDPIETHPDYLALLEIYGGTEDENGKAKWPKTLSPASEFEDMTAIDGNDNVEKKNPMHGVESYLLPGATWVRKSVAKVFPVALIRALGTIDKPGGNPPPLTGNRSWLKVRARATWRGNIWQIEEAWLLSGPEGWVPEMYPYG